MNNVPNVNFMLNYVENFKTIEKSKNAVKYRRERGFYSSQASNNDYVNYVSIGSKEKVDYVAYSGNAEKSCGVFNQNGLMNKESMKNLREKLRKTNSVIWHGVLSFQEDFGNTYCNTYEKAYNLMKSELPKFFKKAGLNPDNIEWFAGLHENTDNKHIHISFFEKEPIRYKQRDNKKYFSRGKIPIQAINYFKTSCELKLLQIGKEIYLKRKTLTKDLEKKIKLGEFESRMKEIVKIMPSTGRLGYDSENMLPYKAQIDMVVNAIIKSNEELHKKFIDFDALLTKRDRAIIEIYNKNHFDYTDKLVRDKCINDLYRRLGNLVIYTARDIRNDQLKMESNSKSRLVQKRIEKNKRKALFNRCMQLNELVEREIISAFSEYRAKLEEANYNRLVEEGIIN